MILFALIPLLPLLASLILALGGRRWGERSHRVGIPAIGLSFGLSVLAFIEVMRNGAFMISLYRLFQSGSLTIDLNFYVDQLTVLLLLLVTGVSTIVHVYSSRYMIGDPRYNRFFSVIALFTSSMIVLVMSGNLLMLLVSWEVMGLCSYLLISHASQRPSACRAATKAFLVNAVADVGLSFGIILTFLTFHTLDIQTILSQAGTMEDQTINILGWVGLDLYVNPLHLIPFLLFLGAMGKSAQIPFHVWLPFAMEAPTPVSALIHAATMVNAGPFLLVRLSPLIMLSPFAMTFMAVIGAATAVFAGIVSLTQSDIKKILAYSTISQIGFMIMTCGLGAFAVAIFHLLSHGCYKAFFFLSTGNALRSVDPSHMHGSNTHPVPQRGFGVLHGGALLLSLIPPFVLFSGSYGYLWEITGFAAASVGFKLIGLITVFVASVSIFRGVFSLFTHGPKTYWPTIGIHASAISSITPKFVNGSVLTGLLVTILVMGGVMTWFWSWFAYFLSPALPIPELSLNEGNPVSGVYIWLLIALGIAVAGWSYAYMMQSRPSRPIMAPAGLKTRLYLLFWNKFYVDEIYDRYLVNPTIRFAHWLWQNIDMAVVDRFIHGIASSTVFSARWLWRVVDIKGIDRVVMGIGQQSVGIGRWLWQVVDIRWLEQKVGQVGKQADAAGHLLQEAEPRTLQHQLLVMILWLVLATGLLYILV
ncbi:MAG: NADH-quinone oxidoreductase subunit L [Nitrospirales bacterium]|nr:NADH-quinone oxidoreductase subunit L [Nitrospira sp.]MDR4500662.1 NADH-quinone oxidoreductase subunit L [Nitrospirales bacterium]